MKDYKEIARKIYKKQGWDTALDYLRFFKVEHIAWNTCLEIKQEELDFESIVIEV